MLQHYSRSERRRRELRFPSIWHSPLLVFPVLLMFTALDRTAHGQDAATINIRPNYAFAFKHGIGPYNAGNQDLFIFRVTPSFQIRSLEKDHWGLRLRFGLLFGIQQFDRIGSIELDDTKIYSVMPGVEFLIPVGSLSTLKPYFDIGFGTTDSGDENAVVSGLGLRSEFLVLLDGWRISFEPALAYQENRQAEKLENENGFTDFRFRATVRYPIGPPRLGGQPDIGIYGSMTRILDELSFTEVDGSQTRIKSLFDVGLVFGFQYPRPKTILGSIPSLQIGYRFGEDFSGWSIRLGGDLVTPVQ